MGMKRKMKEVLRREGGKMQLPESLSGKQLRFRRGWRNHERVLVAVRACNEDVA